MPEEVPPANSPERPTGWGLSVATGGDFYLAIDNGGHRFALARDNQQERRGQEPISAGRAVLRLVEHAQPLPVDDDVVGGCQVLSIAGSADRGLGKGEEAIT